MSSARCSTTITIEAAKYSENVLHYTTLRHKRRHWFMSGCKLTSAIFFLGEYLQICSKILATENQSLYMFLEVVAGPRILYPESRTRFFCKGRGRGLLHRPTSANRTVVALSPPQRLPMGIENIGTGGGGRGMMEREAYSQGSTRPLRKKEVVARNI